MRTAQLTRTTKETSIQTELNLDGTGILSISTGIGFFDHMLEQLGKHSGIDLSISAKGDLHIDDHHLVEDVGLAVGECILKALGDKTGINRYGFFYVPMDETLVRVVIDLSGRPYCVFNASFTRDKVGEMNTEMVREFFVAISNTLKCNLHIEVLYGVNDHHKIEGIFKGFARALKEAISITGTELPSTKGKL